MIAWQVELMMLEERLVWLELAGRAQELVKRPVVLDLQQVIGEPAVQQRLSSAIL